MIVIEKTDSLPPKRDIKVGDVIQIEARIVGEDRVYRQLVPVTQGLLDAINPSSDAMIRFAHGLCRLTITSAGTPSGSG